MAGPVGDGLGTLEKDEIDGQRAWGLSISLIPVFAGLVGLDDGIVFKKMVVLKPRNSRPRSRNCRLRTTHHNL